MTPFPIMKNSYFYLFCIFHFLFWTMIMIVCNANPTHDSLEGIAWGRLWQWGYPEHPFLAPWLTALVTDLFGVVGWPIYALASISIILCFWTMWRLAIKILTPWHAFISIVLLEGIYYYNVESVNFNPNILMLPLWGLLALSFYNAITLKKHKYWLAVGICAGLAFVTKYESLILFLLLFLILILSKEGRLQFKNSGIYFSVLLFFIIILPNLHHLYLNNFDAVYNVINKVTPNSNYFSIKEWLIHPFEFFVAQALAITPLLLLSIPLIKNRDRQNNRFQNHFDKIFFLVLACGPLIFSIVFSLIMNTALAPRWAVPFFSFIGIVWVAYLNPVMDTVTLKRVFIFTSIWVVIVATLMVKTSVIDVYWYGGSNRSNHFPGNALMETVNNKWIEIYHTKPIYVIGDYRFVSNIAAHSKAKMIPFYEGNVAKSPWVNLDDMQKKGAIVICRYNARGMDEECKRLKKKYTVHHESVFSLHPMTNAKIDNINFWVGFLEPGQT